MGTDFVEIQSSEFWIEESKEIPNINIAPIATASFFDFYGNFDLDDKTSESKKDIVESGLEW